MKKRIAIYCVVGLLVYVGFLTYCFFSDGVTRANYRLIKTEMTKSQIHRLLGGMFATADYTEKLPLGTRETWYGDEGTIILVFDDKGQIIWKEWDDRTHRRKFPDNLFLFGVDRVRE
jgi:hypothetical protein